MVSERPRYGRADGPETLECIPRHAAARARAASGLPGGSVNNNRNNRN